jgi:hypothetical protein
VRVLCALALCLSIACAPRHPVTTSGIPAAGNFRAIPLGLCEDYPEESRSLAAARRDLEVAKTNDLAVLRIAFGWDAMEPEPGQYDWSFWDEFVRMATDEYGIRLIPYVCYTPKWASTGRGDDFWNHPPKDNARFASFMKQIVQRYKDRIDSWEIWNEPDNPAYWNGTVEQFAALLQAGGQAVREADPHAKVVLGGLAWDLNFLEALLTNAAAMKTVDVVNLHNYYETWATEPIERLPDYVGRAHDLIHQYGFRHPIWMAEVGYSNFRQGARVSSQYIAKYQSEHTAQAQAASLVRVLTLLLASGKVSLIAWYRVNDLPATEEVIGDANNRYLGILDESGRPKPAFDAIRFFQSLLPGAYRCIDTAVRVSKPIAAPVEVHAFEREDGTVVVFAWLRTYIPGTRGGQLTGELQDDRAERIALSFPFPLQGDAAVFNETGDGRGTVRVHARGRQSYVPAVKVKNGTVTVLKLKRLTQ